MTTLDKIIEAIGNVREMNHGETMSHVDVINRLQMNDRQQHNFDRLDSQVDAHMKNQHGECYQKPELDMAEHRINSPTINIGADAALAMSDAAGIPIAPKPRFPDWLKAGLLAGATGLGAVALSSYLTDDSDTRNVYDIRAMPFDPESDPNTAVPTSLDD